MTATHNASLYDVLGHPVRASRPDREGDVPPPDTVLTHAIETIDNDRATALLHGVGYL